MDIYLPHGFQEREKPKDEVIPDFDAARFAGAGLMPEEMPVPPTPMTAAQVLAVVNADPSKARLVTSGHALLNEAHRKKNAWGGFRSALKLFIG